MIYVGTSGYGYHNWSPRFYPSWLCHEDYLDFYSERFKCCELTFTHYRMPTRDDQERLLNRSGGRVVFTVKAHRVLTHRRPLETKDLSFARRFAASLTPLVEARKLGAILAQFPFSFINNPDHRAYLSRLRTALDGFPLVVEFRHDSWFPDNNEETLHFLRGWDIGVACVDTPELPKFPGPSALVTSGLGYVRFQGRNASRWWKWWAKNRAYRYDYNYRRRELMGWLPRLREIERQSQHTFVVFSNHWQGQAVANAQALQRLLKRSRATVEVRRRAVAAQLIAG